MAAEMKSSKIAMAEDEMVKPSALESVDRTAPLKKEEVKKAGDSLGQAKMRRQWSENSDNQFQDAKKCTIM
jgi:hypothetical protein